jgi:hypothetical protein
LLNEYFDVYVDGTFGYSKKKRDINAELEQVVLENQKGSRLVPNDAILKGIMEFFYRGIELYGTQGFQDLFVTGDVISLCNMLELTTGRVNDNEITDMDELLSYYVPFEILSKRFGHSEFSNPNKREAIFSVFRTLTWHYKQIDQYVERLSSLLHSIDESNYSLFLKGILIPRFFPKGLNYLSTVREYVEYFSSEEVCYDYATSNLEELDQLFKHLAILSQPIVPTIIQLINDPIDKSKKDSKRLKYVILNREHKSLDVIGQELSLTRERVRQIEKSGIELFDSFYRFRPSREKLVSGLKAIFLHQHCIERQDLTQYLGEAGDLLYFLSSRGNSDFITVYDNLGLLSVESDDWVAEIEAIIAEFDNRLHLSFVEQFVAETMDKYRQKNMELTSDVVFRILEQFYHREGNVFSTNKISYAEKYKMIVQRYFHNGIHVYDESEIERFRKYYKREFHESIEDKSVRAISARLTDSLVLIDRGTYNAPERVVSLDNTLLEDIEDFILSHTPVTTMKQIFREFKDRLISQGVSNEYYLHGRLKEAFGDKYHISKDAVSPTGELNYLKEILDYINHRKDILTMQELYRAFPYYENYQIMNYIYSLDNIVHLFGGRLLLHHRIEHDEDQLSIIREILDDYTSNGPTNAAQVLDTCNIRLPRFILDNDIQYPFDLFSVLVVLLQGEYEFSRPFIARKGEQILDKETRITNFLQSFDELYIDELRDYLDAEGIFIYSIQQFIISNIEDYYWVDVDLLVRREFIDLSDASLQSIEVILRKLLQLKGIVKFEELNFDYFPSMNYRWTPYLLYSICVNHFPQFKLEIEGNQYKMTRFTIRT